MRKLIYILLPLLCLACQRVEEVQLTFVACAPIPVARASAVAFAYEGKAYVFGGRDVQGNCLSDLWEYDPTTDSWQQKGETPLKGRVRAFALTMGDEVYVGLGGNQQTYLDSCYFKDVWRYSPKTDQWKRVADSPSAFTIGAIPYAAGGKLYLYYPGNFGWSCHILCYDPQTDSWSETEEKRRESATGGHGMAGTTTAGRCFIGTGYHTKDTKDWWEVLPAEQGWLRLPDIPGKARSMAVAAGTDQYVYLMGGRHFAGDMSGGGVLDDVMRYSLVDNTWSYAGTLPQGKAECMTAVTVNGKVYFGLGEADRWTNISNCWYRIEE